MTPPQPRLTPAEFATEVRLSGARYVVVEGPSDRSFFNQWFRSVDAISLEDRPIVTTVDRIEIDGGTLVSIGLTDGARSRVIYLAQFAHGIGLNIMCVADRDCDHDVTNFSFSTLAWTDFPAIESYGFEPAALDTLNEMFIGGRMPDGASVVGQLSPALLELYTVRLHNQHLSTPRIASGGVRRNQRLDFDVSRTVDPQIAAALTGYVRPTFPDARSHAYGHDIAELLLLFFANIVRNQAGIRSAQQLDANVRASILIAGSFNGTQLAQRLLTWLLTP